MEITFEDSKGPIESNEVDRNAMGGTELMKYDLQERVSPELLNQFQIIPSRVREIDEEKNTILWLHDLPNDPESQHLADGGWEKFDKLVFVSNWQLQAYNSVLGVPYSKSVVLRNAISPIPEHVKPDNEIRIIYHTTPHRGLEILVPVFVELAKLYDDIVLDVYSSFNAYGWPERDKPYEQVFDLCREHPQINYHGFQPNEVIREALQKAHIFAYPSIWPETSCIALIEAMSAGCMCIHPNYAALPETSSLWNFMYQWDERIQQHANVFGQSLQQVIEIAKDQKQKDQMRRRLDMQRNYINAFYDWDIRAREWVSVLNSVLVEKSREQ